MEGPTIPPTTPTPVARLLARFAGNERAHGTYRVDKIQDNGKKVGQAITKPEPVTAELWEKHLKGEQRLGIVPIRDDNTCVFGAIDIDSYKDFDVAAVAAKVSKLGLPLVVCKSKSGGAHLYLFSKEPRAAKDFRARLGEMAKALGLKADTEIFPKQSQIDPERKDMGSWINIPYFEGPRTMVFAIRGDGTGLTLAQFLDYADLMAVDGTFFDQPVKVEAGVSEWFPEGPPCLQTLVTIAMPEGGRNNGFYNVCIYLKKAFPDDWRNRGLEYAARFFDPPLPRDEMHTTMRSVAGKGYQYTCKREPIRELCDSAVCRGRRYGVGQGPRTRKKAEPGAAGAGANGGKDGESDIEDIPSFPILGQLRKLDTDPPLWFLDVDDRTVELTTEELQSPRLFQKRCMDVINDTPPLPTATSWQRILRDKMVDVVIIEIPDSASLAGEFFGWVEKFCIRSIARNKEEILSGQPWTDPEAGLTWFEFGALKRFLDRNHFKDLKSPKMVAILRAYGGVHDTFQLRGKSVEVWGVPEFKKPEPRAETESETVF